MTTLPKEPMAQWDNKDQQKPLDFLYQENKTCLVTSLHSFVLLKPNEAVTTHTLEGIQELVQLQSWKKQYLLLAFDETTYTNLAYQVDNLYPLSKHLLEDLEDPKSIVYSPLQDILYYKHSNVHLYSYDVTTKTSTALLADREVSELCISDNGQYLALENSEEVVVVNTADYSIVQQHEFPPNTSYSLVGITDEGQLMVVNHPVARKNEAEEATTPTVVLLQESGEKTLVASSNGWAKWDQGHLLVLDQNHFKLYDQTILK